MNFFTISKFIGTLLLIFGASMLPPLLWGFADGSWGPMAWAMMATAAAPRMTTTGRRGLAESSATDVCALSVAPSSAVERFHVSVES